MSKKLTLLLLLVFTFGAVVFAQEKADADLRSNPKEAITKAFRKFDLQKFWTTRTTTLHNNLPLIALGITKFAAPDRLLKNGFLNDLQTGALVVIGADKYAFSLIENEWEKTANTEYKFSKNIENSVFYSREEFMVNVLELGTEMIGRESVKVYQYDYTKDPNFEVKRGLEALGARRYPAEQRTVMIWIDGDDLPVRFYSVLKKKRPDGIYIVDSTSTTIFEYEEVKIETPEI